MKNRIDYEIDELQKAFPKLSYVAKEDSEILVEGELDLIDPDDGVIWETFSIRIVFYYNFPQSIPKLYLVSHNIPWDYSRHIGSNGGCCIAPSAEQRIILGRDYSLIEYFNKLVIPFFASQKMYSLGLGWANGEYAHFTEGLIEYYKIKLDINDNDSLIIALRILTGECFYKRNDQCFCGSGKKYKKCHYLTLGRFFSVDKRIISSDLSEILTKLKIVK